MLRYTKLTVADEIENALSYYRITFLRELPALYDDIEDEIGAHYGSSAEEAALGDAAYVQMGSWIGGDRDGNPNVNADTMQHALVRHSTTILDFYLDEVHALGAELSISTLLVPSAGAAGAGRRLARPVRRTASRRTLPARPDRHLCAPGRHRARAGRHQHPAQGSRPRRALRRRRPNSRRPAPSGRLAEATTAPSWSRRAWPACCAPRHLRLPPGLARHAPEFGRARARAGRAVRLQAGVEADYAALDEDAKVKLLLAELAQPRLLYSPYAAYSTRPVRAAGAARRARDPPRYGARAIRNYIISHTETVSDLLEVLLLQKETGLLRPQAQQSRRDGDPAVRNHPRPAARRRHHGSLDGAAAGRGSSPTRAGCRKSCWAIRTRTRTAASSPRTGSCTRPS
jgi:phosphoenolpyruvate carboxylase